MFDHITIGTADINQASAFYDAVLGTLGYGRKFEEKTEKEGLVAVGYGTDRPVFWVVLPVTGKAVYSPGTHVAFRTDTQQKVHEFYDTALTHGGADDGPPGPRPQYHKNYYAAFVRDPDGHKIEAVFGNS